MKQRGEKEETGYRIKMNSPASCVSGNHHAADGTSNDETAPDVVKAARAAHLVS